MSLDHAPAPHRRDRTGQVRVPVVLPQIDVRIDPDGLLGITVDREPYTAGTLLTRDDLHRVLDQITHDLGSPVRVEIREPDDSVFTDIVTPEPQRRPAPDMGGRASITSSPGEVAGGGFVPDEDVAIAVVVAHQVAGADGTARLRLPAALLAGRPGLVVLVGRTSGSVAVSGAAG